MAVDTISFTRRRLPHWEVAGKSYFVTFRLRGSLPKSVIDELQKKREELKTSDGKENWEEFERYEFKIIENILDSVDNSENAFLCQPDIAPVLMERFEFLEQKFCWRVPVYVIMPNHVHCLCIADKAGDDISLTQLIAKFKQYTARRINGILNRKGRLWVDENFDHWCRNSAKEISVIKYIVNNPVKAGLVKNPEDWKWGKR